MQIRVWCEACQGTGRNEDDRDDCGVCSSCPECHGEGTVAMPEPQQAEAVAAAELGIAWSEAMQRLYALLAAAGVH